MKKGIIKQIQEVIEERTKKGHFRCTVCPITVLKDIDQTFRNKYNFCVDELKAFLDYLEIETDIEKIIYNQGKSVLCLDFIYWFRDLDIYASNRTVCKI